MFVDVYCVGLHCKFTCLARYVFAGGGQHMHVHKDTLCVWLKPWSVDGPGEPLSLHSDIRLLATGETKKRA